MVKSCLDVWDQGSLSFYDSFGYDATSYLKIGFEEVSYPRFKPRASLWDPRLVVTNDGIPNSCVIAEKDKEKRHIYWFQIALKNILRFKAELKIHARWLQRKYDTAILQELWILLEQTYKSAKPWSFSMVLLLTSNPPLLPACSFTRLSLHLAL